VENAPRLLKRVKKRQIPSPKNDCLVAQMQQISRLGEKNYSQRFNFIADFNVATYK